MGKPNIPNFSNKNKALRQRIEKYVALINNVYEKMSDDALNLASLCNPTDDEDFSFSDYPFTKDAIKQLQQNLYNGVYSIILSSTSEEWKNSNLVQDLVARKVLKKYVGTTKAGKQYSRYFQTNPDSLKAFQRRRVGKMNLSTNVWELTEQHISELEDSISLAIADGTSAMSLAASVKQYLKDPNKRFRRRKEILADGSTKWHLSKNAKQYHPGAGRYRSSARNAQRLARTEINMAYRTAEQTRWEQFDFVVGYEIKTTYSEKHVTDICDQLAGKYPKSFHFVGWHPNCMCYCIPILKTEDEFWADDSEDSTKSVNEITRVPDKFNEWIRDNKERIETAENNGKLPYFIRDNKVVVEDILFPRTSLEQIKNDGWTIKIRNEKGNLDIDSTQSNEWLNTQFGKLDYVLIKQNLSDAINEIGLDSSEFKFKLVWHKHLNVARVLIDGPKLELERKFKFVDGNLYVEHSFFDLDENLQGNGFSKNLLSIFFDQYQKAGIKKIELQANLDIGGYAWARYGFTCDKVDVKNVIYNCTSLDVREAATKIVDSFYENHNENEKFQMRNLTGYEWSKYLLLGSKWNGELLFDDIEAMRIFKSYLKS